MTPKHLLAIALYAFAAVADASLLPIEEPPDGQAAAAEVMWGSASENATGATAQRLAPNNFSVNAALSMGRPVTYQMLGTTVAATIGSITNTSAFYYSGTLRVRLFVTTTPIPAGGVFNYWTVAEFPLTPSTLQAGEYMYSLSGTAPLLAVPDGVYYFHIGIFEFEPPGSCGNASSTYCMDDYLTFDGQVRSSAGFYSAYTPPPSPPLSPETGVWWNPAESGTGYVVSIKSGVLVMQIYSYRADGEPQWYLVAGAMTNGNRNFSGPLTKYRGGQCITCSAYRAPTPLGDDGTVSIVFTSNTSATVRFPGGRTTNIVPFTL